MKQRPVDENGKRIILVQIDPKYLLDSDRDKYYRQNWKNGRIMDYISMVKALKEGKKATVLHGSHICMFGLIWT